MSEKILIVDNEAENLQEYPRIFHKGYFVETAAGGSEALKILDKKGPFAVVLASLDMDGMDGLEMLSRIWSIHPNTVRILITNEDNTEEAITAVNEKIIFRFLTRPFTFDHLKWSVEAAMAEYRRVAAERELLEKTLSGSIKTLLDTLGLVNPVAFGKTNQIMKYVKFISERLGLKDIWQYEVASMLSLIGCVTIPPDILEKVYNSEKLTVEEKRIYRSHPKVGYKLITNIPRLELIAQMIEKQLQPYKEWEINEEELLNNHVFLGAQMIKIATDFDRMLTLDIAPVTAWQKIFQTEGLYHPKIINALENVEAITISGESRKVTVKQLQTFMVLGENILTSNGTLLAVKGQNVTISLKERLRNFSNTLGVIQPFRVYIVTGAYKKED